ncbi:MAG: VOC family protein [Candidatus Freyarchaeota archaeon]|nr:VOC family protein [Candidatus Jordarchaeia archaeon]
MVSEPAFSEIGQIGVVVKDFERTAKALERLGIGPFSPIEIPHGSARLKIGLVNLGSVQLELIQVVEGESIHSRFIKERGEGLHHIGFFVKDIEGILKELEKKGVRASEGGEVMGVKYVYLDTEEELGFYLELIQV